MVDRLLRVHMQTPEGLWAWETLSHNTLPLKANVHECMRTIPLWELYAPCNLSIGSFGVNVCVAMLGHLGRRRIATTSIHWKLVKSHRKACRGAGRHVHCRKCHRKDYPR